MLGYVHFLNDRRESVRKENPDISFADISKKLAVEWGQVNEELKAEYVKRAEADKERYNKEFAAYQQTQEYKDFIKVSVCRSSQSILPAFNQRFKVDLCLSLIKKIKLVCNYKCNFLSRQEQESQWANDSENCGSPSQSKKIKKEGGGEQKKPKKKKTSEGGKLKRSEEEEDDDARPLTSASPFVR